jgi:hypothetical protein
MVLQKDEATAKTVTKAASTLALTDAQIVVEPKTACTVNTNVKVTVSYPMTFITGLFGANFTLTGKAVMRCGGWGAPTGGVSVLPLAFSWCEFKLQTGGGVPSSTVQHTILFTKSSQTSCTGPSNNIVPGGFGWLTTQAGSCTAKSAIADVLYSAPGNSVPSGCGTADFEAYQGKVVLRPIFNEAGDTGSNAWYRIYGYAAFTITGYDFGPGKYT